MKRMLCFLLPLCLLLLCTCGSPKEPAGLALPAAEALQQGYAGLIFSSQAAPAYLLSASDLPRLLTLLAQAEPAALPQAPEVLFRLEYLCPDPVETPTRQYLDFCSQDGRTFCKRTAAGQWFRLPEALEQFWTDAGIDAEFLYDPNRQPARRFEACREALAEYRLPQQDAAGPQQALELLFGQFLASLHQPSPYRTFLLLDEVSMECRLFDSSAIAAEPYQDWGYASEGLSDDQWLTVCSAGVTFSGTLDTWGFSCCGQSPGADALRWGNLRLEGGEYIFLPCESAVSALSPDA